MLGVKNSVYANLNQISEMKGTAALLQFVLCSCNNGVHLDSNANAFILCNIHIAFHNLLEAYKLFSQFNR